MRIEHFIGMVGQRSGSVGATDSASTAATLGWVLVGAAIGVMGTLATQAYLPSGQAPARSARSLPVKKPTADMFNFRPGWYVVLYDNISDKKHYHGKGRLKQMEGPFDSKNAAEFDAVRQREGGWRADGDARAVVKNLINDPFESKVS